MKNYHLYLNEKQLSVINSALNLYSRLLSGQVDELHHFFTERIIKENVDPQTIRYILKSLKINLFPEFGNDIVSYGITAKEIGEPPKIAYDIYQVIRHKLSWDNNPKGGYTVNYREPFKTSEGSLPKIWRTLDSPEEG